MPSSRGHRDAFIPIPSSNLHEATESPAWTVPLFEASDVFPHEVPRILPVERRGIPPMELESESV